MILLLLAYLLYVVVSGVIESNRVVVRYTRSRSGTLMFGASQELSECRALHP